MFRWKIFRYKATAITWLMIMCFLFFLPGSALPEGKWLDGIYIDKWVHVGLFAVLLFLWRSAFYSERPYYGWILFAMAVSYGFLVEVIQLYWVANRSFDLLDLLSDSVGSALGLLFWWGIYKKNKPL